MKKSDLCRVAEQRIDGQDDFNGMVVAAVVVGVIGVFVLVAVIEQILG